MMSLLPSQTLQRRPSVFLESKYLQNRVGLEPTRSRSCKYPISSDFTNILPKRGLIIYTSEKGKIDPVNTAEAYGGEKAYLHAFLFSALGGCAGYQLRLLHLF
jgi:hypothetical protein